MASGEGMEERIRAHFEGLNAADSGTIAALLDEDFVQDWPQSGERVRGRVACLRVLQEYPGGPPQFDVHRVTGSGDLWVVEAIGRYGTQPVHIVAILEFRDGRIVHETDYFGDPFPAPAWRAGFVEMAGTGPT